MATAYGEESWRPALSNASAILDELLNVLHGTGESDEASDKSLPSSARGYYAHSSKPSAFRASPSPFGTPRRSTDVAFGGRSSGVAAVGSRASCREPERGLAAPPPAFAPRSCLGTDSENCPDLPAKSASVGSRAVAGKDFASQGFTSSSPAQTLGVSRGSGASSTWANLGGGRGESTHQSCGASSSAIGISLNDAASFGSTATSIGGKFGGTLEAGGVGSSALKSVGPTFPRERGGYLSTFDERSLKSAGRPLDTGFKSATLRHAGSRALLPTLGAGASGAGSDFCGEGAADAGDLDVLRARLSAVVDQKPRVAEASALKSAAPPAIRLDLLGDSSQGWSPISTARTEISPLGRCTGAMSGLVVNHVVDTCFRLEHVLTSGVRAGASESTFAGGRTAPASPMGKLARTQRTQLSSGGALARTAPSSALPSARWNASAAMAAVRSAEAAAAAAEEAAAASRLAADEAAKAAAAAKAATGRYDDIVDWLLVDGDGDALDASAAPTASTTLDQFSNLERTALPSLPEIGLDGSQETRNCTSQAIAGAAQYTEEGDDDETDVESEQGLKQDLLEAAEELAELDVDLEQPLSLQTWLRVADIIGLDEDEAMDEYHEIEQEYREHGRAISDAGFPLREFLEELNIDLHDREGVEHFIRAVEAAEKAEEKSMTEPSKVPEKSTQLTMFDKVVRTLDKLKASEGEAWRLVQQGAVPMSKAEKALCATFEGREDEFLAKVAAYGIRPPMVNATAGQTVNRETCIKTVTKLIADCQAAGSRYTDPDWNFSENAGQALYVDGNNPGYDCTVAKPARYKRLTDIVKSSASTTSKALSSLFGGFGGGSSAPKPEKKPVVFKGSIGAGDIVQGQIGTCFLLGALGAIASRREESVQRMFIKYDVDVGVYGIRFNKHGEWVHVIVDDWFPVDANGELLYSRCKDPQEVWVPLLEKAFCKLHTCYEMCDGGRASEAVFSFFGGVSGRFMVKRKHMRNPHLYFKLMKHALDRGWLLTSGFVARAGQRGAGSGKCGEAMLPGGLVAGHAYSILNVVEAHGEQLVCIRNPWGAGEWTGKWSDKNEFGEWTDEMKEATGFNSADDGKFWMSIADFTASSAGVEYARTFGPNWKKVTFYKYFRATRLEGTAKKKYVAKRSDELSFERGDLVTVDECSTNGWWLGRVNGRGESKTFPGSLLWIKERAVMRFDMVATADETATGPMTAVILLMQPGSTFERRFKRRREDGLNYKDLSYGPLQLIIVGPDGALALTRQGRKRCVWGEVSLPGGGLWRIYALSPDGKERPCTVRIYLKDGTADITEVTGAKFSELSDLLGD
eukprot:TRINITY_DN12610_c0_g1_i1.p1 TRINITY_DN12610_c0_g1~~TRINITY_DN12610_c0_g1_i1.p1  ORF type:complete len:1317 (-),score=230.73 TRINITY_DN12610_c0_g1_i1:132-4082(-)